MAMPAQSTLAPTRLDASTLLRTARTAIFAPPMAVLLESASMIQSSATMAQAARLTHAIPAWAALLAPSRVMTTTPARSIPALLARAVFTIQSTATITTFAPRTAAQPHVAASM
jgi:hypothetical protein